MTEQACAASLRELQVATGRVERAIRQIDRAQECHRAEQAERARIGFESGFLPDSVHVLEIDFRDAMDFAIAAARSAARAHQLLVDKVPNLRGVRDVDALRALRDLDEHWDAWQTIDRDPDTDEEWRPWIQTNAGRRWEQFSPHAPGSNHGATVGPDSRITHWSGISIDQVYADLVAIRKALTPLREEAYEVAYPTEEAAIELVGGVSMWSLMRRLTTVRGFRDADGVRRFRRVEVLRSESMIRGMPGCNDCSEP